MGAFFLCTYVLLRREYKIFYNLHRECSFLIYASVTSIVYKDRRLTIKNAQIRNKAQLSFYLAR